MNWHEWIERSELPKVLRSPQLCLRSLSQMELSLQYRAHFVDLIVQMWCDTVSFVRFIWSTTWWRCGWHMKSSSRYSFPHILSTSSSKSGLRPSVFFNHSMWSTTWLISIWLRYVYVCNQAPATVSRTFCRPHLQKVVGCQFFAFFFCEIELSLPSRAHFVDLIFKKWSEAVNFLRYFCEIELSLQSRPHFFDLIFKKCEKPVSFFDFHVNPNSRYSLVQFFVDLIFKTSSKSAKCPSVFFWFLMWNRALAYSLVHILSTTFRIEARNCGNRDPPAATTDSHFTRKNTGFCVRELFSRECTRSRSLTLPNYLMMMWLTWWCGWHDDWDDDVVAMMVRQLAIDNRP